MADNLSLFGSAVEQGLRLYDKTQDRSKLPASKRIFLESTLDNKKTPITEKELSRGEQEAFKSLIFQKYEPLTKPLTQYKDYLEKLLARKDANQFYVPEQLNQAKQDLKTVNSFLNGTITPEFLKLANLGKGTMVYSDNLMREAGVDRKQFDIHPNIQYKDYAATVPEAMNNFTVVGNDPRRSLQTLLGRFNFGVDSKGNFTVKEDYDFNEAPKGVSQESTQEVAPILGPYQVLREYAGEKLPPGQGRAVNISVPMAPLEYRDPFGQTIK